MAFKIASSPHATTHTKTSQVMQRVALCALPGIAAQWYFFGWGNLIQIAIAVVVALSAEALFVKLRRRPVMAALGDYSALVTAVLIGICMPPLAPWWIVALGAFFAIVVAKQLYGGLGQNLFNPAMVAYVALLISFPVQMTAWLPPQALAANALDLPSVLEMIFLGSNHLGLSMSQLSLGIDGVTMATPLDTLKTDLTLGLTAGESFAKPIFDGSFGVGWAWVNAGFLLGGLIMLKLKVIRWHIPVAVLAALGLSAFMGTMLHPDGTGGLVFHWFSGAAMFGAFFIATDPVTAATSTRGRLIFGALIGLLVYLIRSFGGYPDAFAFAVLLANMCAPMIDYYTRPRTYGHGSE
ncbi:electron transport complex subunit RsxD [Ferrimonas sp. SCSIO 43195]|uniref:electron transport complex subunit RsxD n=1 Tax=Ferrimonas sp. SCSIO 43195 TaxID=2822844 RepID=UPI00207629DB|nr:electron transport complex subunit RsxD [Ferrimonas sp. SCSIO 43195]USD39286.1 electron transport complex subunit RsxD [Ferrimonas sp. SCSIO 43195]